MQEMQFVAANFECQNFLVFENEDTGVKIDQNSKFAYKLVQHLQIGICDEFYSVHFHIFIVLHVAAV